MIMKQVSCHSCQAKITVQKDASIVVCTSCQTTIDISDMERDTTAAFSIEKVSHETLDSFDYSSVNIEGYEITGMLGRGGMGVVLKGVQTSLGREVAIKLLNEEFSDHEMFVERFERESKALASLSHPGIVAVIERGKTDSTFYFVMELISGSDAGKPRDLKDIIRVQPSPLDEVIRYAGQIADALGYAHGKGIIHRDIKPSNILLDTHGNTKIADFGIASLNAVQTEFPQLTIQASAMGTYDYMAPEQRKDASSVDERADIYSFGVMLYEMLTGYLPSGAYTPASKLRDDISVVWDNLINDLLQPVPSQRFQSLEAISGVLEQLTIDPAAVYTCGKCGARSKEAVEFCPSCGVPQSTVCLGCEAKVKIDLDWCPNCGNNVNEQIRLEQYLTETQIAIAEASDQGLPLDRRFQAAYDANLILAKSLRLDLTVDLQGELQDGSKELLSDLGLLYGHELRYQGNLGKSIEVLDSTFDAVPNAINAKRLLDKANAFASDLQQRKLQAFKKGDVRQGIKCLTSQVDLFPDVSAFKLELANYQEEIGTATDLVEKQIPTLIEEGKWWQIKENLKILSGYEFPIKGSEELEQKAKQRISSVEVLLPNIQRLFQEGKTDLCISQIEQARQHVEDHPELLAVMEELEDINDDLAESLRVIDGFVDSGNWRKARNLFDNLGKYSATAVAKSLGEKIEAAESNRTRFKTIVSWLFVVPALLYGMDYASSLIVKGLEFEFIQESLVWQAAVHHGFFISISSVLLVLLRNYAAPRFRILRWCSLACIWSISYFALTVVVLGEGWFVDKPEYLPQVFLYIHFALLGLSFTILLFDFVEHCFSTSIKMVSISLAVSGLMLFTTSESFSELYLIPSVWLVSWLIALGILREWYLAMFLVILGGLATFFANGILQNDLPLLQEYGKLLTVSGYVVLLVLFIGRASKLGRVLAVLLALLFFSPYIPVFNPLVTFWWVCSAAAIGFHQKSMQGPWEFRSPLISKATQ